MKASSGRKYVKKGVTFVMSQCGNVDFWNVNLTITLKTLIAIASNFADKILIMAL